MKNGGERRFKILKTAEKLKVRAAREQNEHEPSIEHALLLENWELDLRGLR
jgi:hypothetical protein